MKLFVRSLSLVFSVSSLVAASAMADASPGMNAFSAISAFAPALREPVPNIRRACYSLGQYDAYASLANPSNTDQWTLRNLGFGQNGMRVLHAFCANPKSTVSLTAAMQAADGVAGNVGLE